ncbi:MAG: FecCD family ABC transporter permease [Candidatus Bathyarchaeia archaeon]
MTLIKKKTSLERARRWQVWLFLLVLFLIIVILVSLNIGSSFISFENIFKIFFNKLTFSNPSYFQVSDVETSLVLDVRLPRILCACLVGAALSIAGAVYQGLFRNPLADPYTIGASAGAALGATASIVLGISFTVLGISTLPIFAFIGCISAVLLVYVISKVGTKVPVQTLLLSGIAVSIFLSAVVSYLQYISPDKLHQSQFWLLGSFSYTEWNDIWSVLLFIGGGAVAVYLYSRDLNLLALGEDEARHLGVDLERVKKILLVSSAFITAAAVSISGLIAFIGLIIPHLTRLMVGPDHRVLIPASMLMGSAFLILCDSAARVLVAPAELPVGIITALCGGPFFLYLMRRKKKFDVS